MKTNRSEKGQAFVLIIVAIVAIFGFAALAVDGGNVYAERRRAQNAADASALAAASAKRQDDPNWKQTALNLAATNGFNNDGTTNTINVYNPPISGPYATVANKSEYFQVVIDTEVDPIFSQFNFAGSQKQTVESVVRYKPVKPGSSGNAIWGVKKDDLSVVIDGATKLLVEGGNVYSSASGKKTGDSENGYINVVGGKVQTVGTWTNDTDVSPTPEEGVAPLEMPNFPQPYCPPVGAGPTTYEVEIDGVDQNINFYHHAAGSLSGKNVTLQSNSVHCVDGDIDFHGGGSLTGQRVLLVMLSGGITSNGNSTTDLTHMESLVINGTQYGGMLIWSGSDHEIVLGGTNESNLTGTIYAPKATCDIGGTDDTNAFYSSFICYDFKFHGTPKIHIIYDATQQAHSPSYFDQSQ